jgi:hypothetical protein
MKVITIKQVEFVQRLEKRLSKVLRCLFLLHVLFGPNLTHFKQRFVELVSKITQLKFNGVLKLYVIS